MKKNFFSKKSLVLLIIVLFFCSGFNPVFGGKIEKEKDSSSLTFYTFDRSGTKKCKINLETGVAEYIYEVFEELKDKITCEPLSSQTEELKCNFLDLLDIYGLIPIGLSKDEVFSLLNPKWLELVNSNFPIAKNNIFSSINSKLRNVYQGSLIPNFGNAAFCSMAGGGIGFLFPPVMLPRPRFFNFWASYGGALTTAASLFTGNGFIAAGPQFGMTIGFMGIGLSWAIVGEPGPIFGFGGYALYTAVGAQEVENYPLNKKPVVSEEDPTNEKKNVSLSLSELSFKITDDDGDKMDYTVTTQPDIGSGQGFNELNGRYSIPISGLEPDKPYTWKVEVTDREDTVVETFSFITAVETPIVSNPIPFDGDDWVPADLTELSFKLEDLQGEPMDYTVETDPDIGNSIGYGVGNGIYTVEINNLDFLTDYTWFVNVTDGEFWTRKVYNFKTQPIMIFDPLNEGWQYCKKITINHSQVTGDLYDFPVLINVVDSDLKNKAQTDGDDILFMDDYGIANRLVHEIERFESATGALTAWVCNPSLSSSSDTEFFIYYGNSGCLNQEYENRVWDDGFEAVWHMSDDGNQMDSTINGNTLIPENAPDYQQESNMGYSCFFDRQDSEYLKCNAIRTEYPISGEVYYKPLDSASGYDHGLFGIADKSGKSILSFMSMAPANNHLRAWSRGSGGPAALAETNVGAIINEWNYIVAKHSAENNRKIWLDLGNEKTNNENKGPIGVDTTAVGTLVYNNGIGDIYNANGWIDEVRISNIVRNDDWYKTTYFCFENSYDGGFFNIGPEQTDI